MSGTSSLTLDSADGAASQPTVEVRLPADGAYAAVLRTLAAGLAARLEFTMDDIEDVRMVVSEAVALVLDQAEQDGELICAFTLADSEFVVSIATDAAQPAEADYENFGWQVLAVLAADADIASAPGRYAVTATVVSSLSEDPNGSEA